MDYLEFIARVTSHIPDKGQVMIRYYGLYSNAHRGKMRKTRDDPSHPPIIDDEVSFERPPPPQIVQQELLMAAEERGEYF